MNSELRKLGSTFVISILIFQMLTLLGPYPLLEVFKAVSGQTPTLTASVSSGIVGSEFVIQGTDLPAGVQVTFFWVATYPPTGVLATDFWRYGARC